MADFGIAQPGAVSLVDADGDACFVLSAECGGAPCRVAVDRSDRSQPVVRLVAQQPGELQLKLFNPSALTPTYFMVRRLQDDHPRDSQVGHNDGDVVNDFNILLPLARGKIDRDKSTEAAMVVEAVTSEGGAKIMESDQEAKTTPRTRFTVLVAPAVGQQRKWNQAYWCPKRWSTAGVGGTTGEGPKMWVRVWVVPSGRSLLLPARPCQTVLQFKETVARKLNVASAGRLRVFYHGEQPLSDIRSLRDCGLSHESEVHVMVAAESGRRTTQGRLMPVRVRCFWEEVRDLVLALRARASVAELKEAARVELAANADHVLRAVRVGLPCGLADEWLLSEVVDEESRVHLIVSTRQDRSKMRLRVQTLSNTELKLLVPRSARVEDLKRQIQAEEGFPPHLQRVLFAGEALEDHALLTDYGITSQSQLRVVLNLRGGGTEPLPEGAETVEAVTPAEVKGDGTRDKEEAGNEDATLAVAKVVAGERRAPPPTSRSNLKVLMISAAPLLVIEVALEAASAAAPAAPASKRIRIS